MYNRIKNDIVTALREKDNLKKNLLRCIISAVDGKVKEAKLEKATDEMVLDAVKSELKQQHQSLDSVKTMPDSDFYKDTYKRIQILEKEYLPKQLTEDELRVEIKKFIDENNLKEKGKGALRDIMPVFKNKGDGKVVNKVAMELLS